MTTKLSTRVPKALQRFFGSDPFEDLQREIDSLFDRFKTNGNGELTETLISPLVDLSEKDDSIQIRMDVPGVNAGEIDIKVSGNTIRISGEHKEAKEESGQTFHRIERRRGSFSRFLTLPTEVKENEVTAECKEGVLTVNLPKKEVVKSRSVKVVAK